ncbi:hypothetical protein Q5P01_016904 [Channa striata]|uniref:Uncharacterized protein n=1 Tax=Channa striata TaxID=64152 RepID=A0AA88SC96_CHASR|nr:hypothetical protein Q5P01_016904 [Channa striata]
MCAPERTANLLVFNTGSYTNWTEPREYTQLSHLLRFPGSQRHREHMDTVTMAESIFNAVFQQRRLQQLLCLL